MASHNKLTIVGNVGKEGDLRYSQGGMAMLQFSVAVADRRKSKSGEWEEETDWFNVTVFGKTAESVAEYVTKGKQVLVEGRVKIREYTTKDGDNRASLDVAASTIVLLGGREDGGNQQRQNRGQNRGRQQRNNDDSYDDLPYE